VSKPINYRHMLLRALEAFKEGTPSSIEKGRQIAQKCASSIDNSTLSGLIWGQMATSLTDSIFYTNDDFLARTHAIVSGSVAGHEVTLLNLDFLSDEITNADKQLYGILFEAATFLNNIKEYEPQTAIDRFKQFCVDISRLQIDLPVPFRLEDELVYRFILREIADITLSIDIVRYVNSGILTPLPPYSIMHSSITSPWVPHILEQMKERLAALEGKGWLYLNIYYSSETIFVTFH
jgi:hypothetical protein